MRPLSLLSRAAVIEWSCASAARPVRCPVRNVHTGSIPFQRSLDTVHDSLAELEQAVNRGSGSLEEGTPQGAGVHFRLLLDSRGGARLQASHRPVDGGKEAWVDVAEKPSHASALDAQNKRTGGGSSSPRLLAWPDNEAAWDQFTLQVRDSVESAMRTTLHRPPESSETASLARVPTPPQVRSTVIDVTTARSEDLALATRTVERLFPRLRLQVQHTSGTDLQQSRTHTFTVGLRPRVPGASLSAAEQRAVSTFTGDAIGLGYHGTLRRALHAAFRAAGMAFPGSAATGGSVGQQPTLSESTSVLSLYHRILATHHVRLDVHLTASSVAIKAIKGDDDPADVLYQISGDARNALSLVLAATESAAEKVDPSATDAVRREVELSALVIVLPEKGVRVKRVLRRLLNYHYGIREEDVDFHVDTTAPGVFLCKVRVPVPFASGAPSALCCLGAASSTNKKMAMRLAAVQTLQDHFTRIFEDQMQYHPEVQELLFTAPATDGAVSPPVSKGLKVILDWAIAQENSRTNGSHGSPAKLSFMSQRLSVGQLHQESGQCAAATVWETILSLTGSQTQDEHAQLRPLRISAIDHKKNRSEQKAFAAALAQRYKHLCPEAVAHAVEHRLVEPGGAPTPCASMVAVGDASAFGASAAARARDTAVPPKYAAALEADPLLHSLKLVPRQSLSLPPPVPATPPILTTLRAMAAETAAKDAMLAASSHTGGGGISLREDISEGRADAAGSPLFLVRLLAVDPSAATETVAGQYQADAAGRVTSAELSRAAHRYKSCALVEAYRRYLNQHQSGETTAGAEETHLDDGTVDTVSSSPSLTFLFDALPATLPPDTPLESVCVAMRDLYGAQVDLHMYADRRRTTVELWGPLPPTARAALTQGFDSDNAPIGAEGEGTYCFLAKGSGSSPQEAALNAALSAFETHVRPLKGVFRGRRLRRVSLALTPAKGSALEKLTSAVTTEITVTGSEEEMQCQAELRAHYNESRAARRAAFDVVFSGVTKNKRVELERVTGAGLLACVCELCHTIATETGQPFSPSVLVAPQSTGAQQLTHLTQQLLGSPTTVETTLVQGEWQCRVSLPLPQEPTAALGDSGSNEEAAFYVCLGTGNSVRKKEAIEKACVDVLASQLPLPQVDNIPGVTARRAEREAQAVVNPATELVTPTDYVYTLT